MDIQSKVVNYYKNNQFIQKYLKGIDPKTNEVVLDFNGETRRVSIDSLEMIHNEEELNGFMQGKTISPINGPVLPEVPVAEPTIETPTISEPVVNNTGVPSIENAAITPVAKEQTILTDNTDLKKETLNDVKLLTELKNKEGLDNILKKFAVNPTTGLLDINTAISTITRNTMNEVEKAIKNNYEFNIDPSLYDTEGNYFGQPIMGASNEDEQIAKSFNNIKIYLDASKMYPEQVNYNDEQVRNFMQTYITKVKEELHGAEGSVPVAEPKAPETPETPNIPAHPVAGIQEVQNNANAGFADIFVLTVIVLVYAVIIVNLILKIK